MMTFLAASFSQQPLLGVSVVLVFVGAASAVATVFIDRKSLHWLTIATLIAGAVSCCAGLLMAQSATHPSSGLSRGARDMFAAYETWAGLAAMIDAAAVLLAAGALSIGMLPGLFRRLWPVQPPDREQILHKRIVLGTRVLVAALALVACLVVIR